MCSVGLAKFILFVSNFFLFIAGGLLLGFGIAAKVDPEGVTKALSDIPGSVDATEVIDVGEVIANSATFMIAVGCFLFVFCFLGCFGGCCMITWMLFLYWVALLVIIILEIALIIFAKVNPGKMKEESVKIMNGRFLNYKPETIKDNKPKAPSDPLSLSWFGIQSQLKCCGVEGKDDYKKLVGWTQEEREFNFGQGTFTAIVPPSCCIIDTKTIQKCMEKGENAHPVGCYDAVENQISKTAYVPIVVCVVVIFIELISIAAAIFLWKQKQSDHMAV